MQRIVLRIIEMIFLVCGHKIKKERRRIDGELFDGFARGRIPELE